MAGRKQRKASGSDSAEAVKPLIVLVLLGTILYGGYSVIQKGSDRDSDEKTAELTEAPPFEAEISPPTPPSVEIAAEPTVTLPAEPAVAMPQPPAFPAPPAGPTYLAGQAGLPPTAGAAVGETGLEAAAVSLGDDPASTLPEVPPPAAFAGVQPTAIPPTQQVLAGEDPSTLAAFTADWAEAHEQLTAGRYAEALALLSGWYDDASLAVEESQRLEDLLGQLAGTVIYSQEDLLMPPHVVGAGETLPVIAGPLGVDWRLLAKINGIPGPDDLYPGESLKVLRGPFDAEVSLSRRRLTLKLTGNYAGSFPLAVGEAVAARAGESLAVIAIDRPSEVGLGGIQQASFTAAEAVTTPAIRLAGDLLLQAADDPAAMAHEPPATHLIVSQAHLADLLDILTPSSRIVIGE